DYYCQVWDSNSKYIF
nr:immunoglobulin light chain junction region [Macaca mulatta]MOW29791.1 immunoglobulin light chain junction region [Macaca mulatta]MOW30900.1 immunoglobulin light chain junction region [Macaca mulatta]